MFELRALYSDVRILYAGGVELCLRLRYVGSGGHASLESTERELQLSV